MDTYKFISLDSGDGFSCVSRQWDVHVALLINSKMDIRRAKSIFIEDRMQVRS